MFPAVDDEFVGPFSSWLTVNTVSDGIFDTTSTIQSALNSIGWEGALYSVVYLPPGTYRITSELSVEGKMNIAFIGANPLTTKIIWDGPIGGTMFNLNGVAYSRFNRINWD